jgi:hypothetical protein
MQRLLNEKPSQGVHVIALLIPSALCAKKSLGALERSPEADVKGGEGTQWVESHPATSSQQPEASFAFCAGDRQGEA